MGRKVPYIAINEKIEELMVNYDYLSKSLQKKLNLTSSAVAIMELLGEEDLSLKQLTEKSILDKSTLSRQVNQLVKKELVIRQTGDDKRYVRFSVTDAGLLIYRQYVEEKTNKIASTLLSWTEEEKQLLFVLLGRLGRSLEQQA